MPSHLVPVVSLFVVLIQSPALVFGLDVDEASASLLRGGGISRALADNTPGSHGGNNGNSGWNWSWGENSSSSASGRPSTSSQSDDIDYADYVHQHGVSPKDHEYPACAMQRSMDEDGLLCMAGASWVALTESVPPSLGFGSNVVKPVDPEKNLPKDFKDLRPLPNVVNQDQIDDEKSTYYWYYRLINNFYGAMTDMESDRDKLDLALPKEWTNQRLYSIVENDPVPDIFQAPLAASYVKGDHMIVLVRGTVYSSEWERDFEYTYASKDEAQAFPGRIHKGFFRVFEKIAKPLDEEMKKHNPTRVTVSGHSLGGAVGNLLAYHIATAYPNIMVDMVSYGAPNVGDVDFVASFNQKVNNRHLTFTGAGDVDDSYQLGDWIAQVPCNDLERCPLLARVSDDDDDNDEDKENENARYAYAALGGVVPFTADDMKNGDTWKYRSDLRSLRYSPVASHVCSYLCFTATSVGDKEDRCVFTLELNTDVDMKYRCAINM